MNLAKRAADAVEHMGGRIKAAVDKLLGNERAPLDPSRGLEGEGSYEGTRRYDAGVEKSVASGRTSELADAANRALDGPEGRALRDAEAAAKAGPRRNGKPTSH